MRRRDLLFTAASSAGVLAGLPLPRAQAAPAQIRVDVEVFSFMPGKLPDAAQASLKRLRRATVLSGPEAEKAAEQLRKLEGQQQVWSAGQFSREAEEGMPIVVRVGRRRQQAQSFGLTLTPSVSNGMVLVEAELRTGKPQPGACDPLVRTYSIKVPMGGYAAFWLFAAEADKPDSIVVARFHPSE